MRVGEQLTLKVLCVVPWEGVSAGPGWFAELGFTLCLLLYWYVSSCVSPCVRSSVWSLGRNWIPCKTGTFLELRHIDICLC